MATAPDEITSLAVLWTVPPGFPEEIVGEQIVAIAAVYAGPADEGERALQPLRELATPLLDLSVQAPYTAVQSSFDPFYPKGRLYYWKSLYLNPLTEESIQDLVRLAESRPSPMSDIVMFYLGGAVGRVAASDTAFGNRSAPILASYESSWIDPADNERNLTWARDAWQSMHRHSPGGLYLNFPGFGEEKEDLVRSAYGANYDRLAELKAQYDPTNLFHMNQNIKPKVMETQTAS